MKRRAFLKALLLTLVCKGTPCVALAEISARYPHLHGNLKSVPIKHAVSRKKRRNNDRNDEIFVTAGDFDLLRSSVERFSRLQQSVGHGNFALIDFDDALTHARYDPFIGKFTPAEIEFLEKIFYQDVSRYGFLGKKPLKQITDNVKKHEFVRVPQTGNYLFTGLSKETYQKMSRDVGSGLILTSGIRGVIKQFYLFLNKALKKKGNLSVASRSLAPPGYSFHGIGDFDVGQVGLGSDNFTLRFTQTDVYRKLKNLDYVKLRYVKNNRIGVRFEPWHIKVIF